MRGKRTWAWMGARVHESREWPSRWVVHSGYHSLSLSLLIHELIGGGPPPLELYSVYVGTGLRAYPTAIEASSARGCRSGVVRLAAWPADHDSIRERSMPANNHAAACLATSRAAADQVLVEARSR